MPDGRRGCSEDAEVTNGAGANGADEVKSSAEGIELVHGGQVDLLVLGAGVTGLTAAARACSAGARVVLVEKGPAVGGSAQYAGYVWTAESYERMREVNPDGDPELARVVVDGIEDGLDWIRSLDVDVGPEVVILGYGRGCQTDLASYITACLAMVRERGEVLTSATAARLLNEGGAVRGAVVNVDGQEREIRATTTLLATGGFGGDPELRAEHIHPLARDIPLRANPYSRGDGLRLGLQAGGTFVGDHAGFYGHLVPSHAGYGNPAEFVSLTFYHSEHGVLLNLDGRRFCDETIADHLNALSVLEQPEARALLICDERVHQQWMLTPYVEGAEAPDKFRLAYNRGARAAIADDLDELEALPPEWGYAGAAARETMIALQPGGRVGHHPAWPPAGQRPAARPAVLHHRGDSGADQYLGWSADRRRVHVCWMRAVSRSRACSRPARMRAGSMRAPTAAASLPG